MYNFEHQKNEWKALPVDDIGYISAERLLKLNDTELLKMFDTATSNRFSGWRNHNNLWRETLGHDSTKGKKILDYGCGIGIESLQFAKDNEVSVADINSENLELVKRIADLKGEKLHGYYLATNEYPYIPEGTFDIIYCNGVLHHIAYAKELLARFFELAPEVRLMLYSDVGRNMCKSDEDFIRTFDAVGNYTDWYSLEKLERMFGDMCSVERFNYITNDNRYLTVTLKKL